MFSLSFCGKMKIDFLDFFLVDFLVNMWFSKTTKMVTWGILVSMDCAYICKQL